MVHLEVQSNGYPLKEKPEKSDEHEIEIADLKGYVCGLLSSRLRALRPKIYAPLRPSMGLLV